MANQVNPPPQLRIPRAFLGDREVVNFFDQQRTILFQLWQKLGGSGDSIQDLGNLAIDGFGVYEQYAIKRLDGLAEFTIDTSGFTTDLTFLTTDKVIA